MRSRDDVLSNKGDNAVVVEQALDSARHWMGELQGNQFIRAEAPHGVVCELTKYVGVSTTSYAVNDDVSDFPMIVNIVMDHIDAVPV